MSIDLLERLYISQYAQDQLGLNIFVAGILSNADGAVTVTLFNEDTLSTVFVDTAATTSTGLYTYNLSSAQTSVPGHYHVTWTYNLNTVAQTYVGYLLIGQANPHYDSLLPDKKDVVDNVWVRFADLFDSPDGGPNLMTYFQTHFGRGRIAQLMGIALGRLNTMSQPLQQYNLTNFPMNFYGSLLESATYIESLRHLVRSYVEQPDLMASGSVTRLDRRDYQQRWTAILDDESKMFKQQLDVFKIRNMGFGRPRVLASGGVYGRYGPTRFAGSVAARPRYWTRFY